MKQLIRDLPKFLKLLWGLYRDHVSDTLLNMMLASLRVDILVTGHTHMPLYVRVKNGVVVNSGSLYTFDNDSPGSSSCTGDCAG